uniref:Allantoate amidinohydrolase n=1 Tax=Seriola lalandi dorsalis TaxID=1841481 RepID=A0A3B4YDD0_SERLL
MAERRTAVKAAEEPDFLQCNDLACETVGGRVSVRELIMFLLHQTNTLKHRTSPPQFVASAFTEFGKWMDGWETRRKRRPGHDWCIIQLGVPGLIYGFDVDTSFFTGNHSPFVSVQAGCLDKPPTFTLEGDRTGMAASDSQLAAVAKLESEAWPELVGVSELRPGYSDCCHNYFKVNFNRRVTHLRLNMYPDGGISRLRVYGVGQRDWSSVSTLQDVDLVALTNGGVCLGYSDAHFGHPRNMIGLGRAANMADGWETARRLDRPKELKVDQRGILQVPGWEWAVFRLGHAGVISSVEVTSRTPAGSRRWVHTFSEILFLCCTDSSPPSPPLLQLRPHHRHLYREAELTLTRPVSHVRLVIAPDGGVSRLRLWGRPTAITAAPTNQKTPASKL